MEQAREALEGSSLGERRRMEMVVPICMMWWAAGAPLQSAQEKTAGPEEATHGNEGAEGAR